MGSLKSLQLSYDNDRGKILTQYAGLMHRQPPPISVLLGEWEAHLL